MTTSSRNRRKRTSLAASESESPPKRSRQSQKDLDADSRHPLGNVDDNDPSLNQRRSRRDKRSEEDEESARGDDGDVREVGEEEGSNYSEDLEDVGAEESEKAELEARSPRRSLNPPGRLAEAGVIKRVYVENFMCHTKLTVELCRNVNFIHGQNGSGKSAILAAIQICLGAGAKRTNRARNLKELVRKETAAGGAPNCAKIRVTLLNQGSDGYKPEIYGDEVTVERTISLHGGYNGYKLLDHRGAEQSRDKKDLYEMLDTLNIQIENPVAILDQEEAKKFLTGRNTDKYEFFMKASDLERLDSVYASTMDSVAELQTAKEKVTQSLDSSVEQVTRLKEKFEQHQQLEKLNLKVQHLQVQYAWALHSGQAASHQEAVDKLADFEKRAAAKQEELTQAEQAADGPNDEGQKKTQRIKDLSQEAGEQGELKQKLEAQLKEIQAPYKARQRELQNIQKRQQYARKAVGDAKRKLQETRDEIVRQAGSHESEAAKRAQSLQKAEAELESAKEKVDELKQSSSDKQRVAEEAETRVAAARQTTRQAQNQISQAERTLASLESADSNSLAVFGSRVTRVAKMVEDAKRQRKFHGPVDGPIGAYLKITPGKEAFAELAELALGNGVLDRFVVTDDRDRKVIQDIRRAVGCQQDCNVFQIHNSGARYQVPDPPVRGVETVASVLAVSSDLIFNCLVDSARIEKIGLGQSKDDSQAKLLTTDTSGRHVVRGGKISQVYFLSSGDMWQVRGGQTSLISNERKMRKTIAADKSDVIAAAKREFEKCRSELEQAKKVEHGLEGEHNKLSRSWNQAHRARKANDKKIGDLMDQIDQIKTEMENAASNVTVDTTVFEDEVQQREEELAKISEAYGKLQADAEDAEPAIAEIKSKIDEVTIRIDKVMQDLQVAETEMTQFLDTQSQKKDAIQKKREKLEKYNTAISKHQERIETMASEMSESLRTARTLQFRLDYTVARRESRGQSASSLGVEEDADVAEPTEADLQAIDPVQLEEGKGPEYFESRLKRAKAKVEKEKENRKMLGDTMEEAFQAYIAAQEELDGKTEEVEQLDKRIVDLRKDIKKRRKRWRQFRRSLEDSSAVKFVEMLDLNNYTGSLEFNHDDRTLDLCVQRGGHAETSQTKDVKALSGGERSYTTMCLLLALGEKLETPFRILDEFDVFLDPQVRKLTINALIHVAKTMEHRQFIFITPQDLTGISPGPQLKIFKLKPPVRHQNVGASQQTINFSQG